MAKTLNNIKIQFKDYRGKPVEVTDTALKEILGIVREQFMRDSVRGELLEFGVKIVNVDWDTYAG